MTMWKDMTDEEKGALLLAKHKGRAIQTTIEQKYPGGWHLVDPQWTDGQHYRVKPAEPVHRTTTQDMWLLDIAGRVPMLKTWKDSAERGSYTHGKLAEVYKDDVLVEFTWRADGA